MFRVCLCVGLLIGVAGVAQAQPPVQLERARSQKADRSINTRLDAPLARLVDELTTSPPADVVRSIPRATEDAVPVAIRFRGASDDLDTALAQLGVRAANKADGIIEALVPVTLLTGVASLQAVTTMQLIVPPVARAVSQGAAVHHATTWHAGGYTGAGVKVGVIDVGFQGLVSLLGTELPASVTARCYVGVGAFSSAPSDCDADTKHGTAVAEALVDVAPGVQLFIANPQSPLDLKATVQWMTAEGVKIINHSVGWSWMGPGDGTSLYLDAAVYSVDLAVSSGALWANAAGNEARATWSGTFRDPDFDDLLDFTDGRELNAVFLQAGQTYIAQARWDDSWSAAVRDLDLYLLDAKGNVVAASESFQAGAPGHVPLELVLFRPGFSGTFYLAVSHFTGPLPAWVDVQSFTGETLQYTSIGGSIGNPADSANPGLLAVGAAPWYAPDTIEEFSSLGPTRDGRTKPDVVGADRGDSVWYGAGAFTGTSQASPHVAGLAALVLQNFPDTAPAQLAAYLKAVSAPRAPANTWGTGFAQVPVFSPPAVNLSALLANVPLPSPSGQTVTWQAFAVGPDDPFEYQFWVFRDGVGWSLGQAYGASNRFSWIPPVPGTYALQVWARRIGSSAAYEAWRDTGSFVITDPEPLSVASLASNVALPVAWATQVTWTAVATGGTHPLQYKFWRLRHGAGWTMVQDYGPSNIYSWTPGASDGGTYTLQVWVRNAGSAAPYDAWRASATFDVFGIPPVTVTSFTPNGPFSSPAYVPITWTASASGGSPVGGPLLYQFWRFRQGFGWTLAQDFSTSNSHTWLPTSADAGSYTMQVWVKLASSGAAYDAWRGTETFVITPPGAAQITSFGSNVLLPAMVGTPITWSASASGGTPPAHFKFWLFDVAAASWTLLQDYSPVASVVWTPLKAGSYSVQVWTRSAGSVAPYEGWAGVTSFSIVPSPLPIVTSLSSSVSLPAMVSNAMTWTAVATGGSQPLEYQFWRLREGVGWTMAQNYSPLPTYTWTPAPGEEGRYALQVWVRITGSTTPLEAWRGTESFTVVPSTVLRLNSQPGDYIGAGNQRIITAADAPFVVSRNFDDGVSFWLSGATTFWHVDFAGPGNAVLVPGVYSNATRFPFQSVTEAGLDVSGDGRGCNMLWARFVVLEVVYGAGGVVERFAADFEQHCEGGAAALFGSVRYNSTVPLVPVEGLVLNGALPGHLGLPLAWTASAAAGREYQFWKYRQSTRTWSLAQSYSTNPVLLWTPQPGDEGTWAIEVWERPVGATAAYAKWRSSGAFTITP